MESDTGSCIKFRRTITDLTLSNQTKSSPGRTKICRVGRCWKPHLWRSKNVVGGFWHLCKTQEQIKHQGKSLHKHPSKLNVLQHENKC